MVRVITVEDVCKIIKDIGIEKCFADLIELLKKDFKRWHEFEIEPRVATHFSHGVIELMPTCDEEYYAFKYVNGHPSNPQINKQTVSAIGALSEIESGYPLMISEMNILTAMRTAATSALAAQYLQRPDSKKMSLIGTGAQAEFLALAHKVGNGMQHIKYFDVDKAAMDKFEKNMQGFDIELERAADTRSAIEGCDVIVTATADKKQNRILQNDWIADGVHISGVGGDCPGKTELGMTLLERAVIVVEFLKQAEIEGEIQRLGSQSVYAELWELVAGVKPGRESDNEVTLFDSVGIALEDYTILRQFYDIAREHDYGQVLSLVPEPGDPKNLFGVLSLC